MTKAPKLHTAMPMAPAAPHHSKLFVVMVSLAAASLVADVGLLVGAVVIH
jgi:hypothetical protein